MSRDFEEKMKQYTQSMRDHPPADSHYALRHIYEQYGVVPVDEWLNNYYGKEDSDGRT